MANGKDGTWVTINGAPILLGSPAHTALLKRIQQRRQAMKDTARGMEEAQAMLQAADLILTEVAPPGWSGTTKAMKKHKGISNPFALSWWMKNQGAEPHKAPEKKEAAVQYVEALVHQATQIMEAVDEEAGTSAGAKAGWEKRKGGGGGPQQPSVYTDRPSAPNQPSAYSKDAFGRSRDPKAVKRRQIAFASNLVAKGDKAIASHVMKKFGGGATREFVQSQVEKYKSLAAEGKPKDKGYSNQWGDEPWGALPGGSSNIHRDRADFYKRQRGETEALAYEVLDNLDRLIEAAEEYEAGTSAGAKAGWERRKRGGDPAPAATPEQIGAQRRADAAKSRARQQRVNDKTRKMDVGGTISPRTERLRRRKALDDMFAKKYANIGPIGHPDVGKTRKIGKVERRMDKKVYQRPDGTWHYPQKTAEAAYEILAELDLLIEALTDEAGTSAGAKAGWEKRKGGGAPQHGTGKELRRMAKRADKDLQGINAPAGERKKMSGMFAGALAKHAMKRAFRTPEPQGPVGSTRFGPGTARPRFGGFRTPEPQGGGSGRFGVSEAAQPVRATLVIREAAGMSSLPQLGRAGVRVPGRPGSGLVRKDNGSVERVPVQKGAFHDDLRRKTSLRRVMHKNQPKVGAA